MELFFQRVSIKTDEVDGIQSDKQGKSLILSELLLTIKQLKIIQLKSVFYVFNFYKIPLWKKKILL